MIAPINDIMIMATLAYLFYHQYKVNEELKLKGAIVIHDGRMTRVFSGKRTYSYMDMNT